MSVDTTSVAVLLCDSFVLGACQNNYKAFHPTWTVASAKYLSICKISSSIFKRNATLYSPVLFNLTHGGQRMNISSTLPRTVFYFVAVRDKTLIVYEVAGLPIRARSWHPNTKYVPVSANSLGAQLSLRPALSRVVDICH